MYELYHKLISLRKLATDNNYSVFERKSFNFGLLRVDEEGKQLLFFCKPEILEQINHYNHHCFLQRHS